MSLADKVANGLAVVVIELFNPCGGYSLEESETAENVCPDNFQEELPAFYRAVMSYILAAMTVCGVLGLLAWKSVSPKITNRPRAQTGKSNYGVVLEPGVDQEAEIHKEALGRSFSFVSARAHSTQVE